MEDIVKLYQELLNKELNSLERERKKHYDHMFDDLASRRMVRADIHIEQALELEMNFMRRFTDYAMSQFKKLMNDPSLEINELEKVYRYGIDLFFGKSLQRMFGIISNVRSSLKEEYAREHLEKIRLEALRELESVKVK
jgi:ribosomal protein L20A (L18A)